MAIHNTAVVAPDAQLGTDVEVGPFCVIGPSVEVGDHTILGPNVILEVGTSLGVDCRVMAGAVLGGPPQDTKYKGEPTYLRIGDRTIIREAVTIHRATGEGNATALGSDSMVMAYAHIGHNARVGSSVTISSYVGISGHVSIEDRVVIGGFTGIHQFVRVGTMAMVGGMSRITQDVPPFLLVQGEPVRPYGLNVVGLRRAGVSTEVRNQLKRAYRLLYRSSLNLHQALERISQEIPPSEQLDYLVAFLQHIRDGRHGRQLDHPR